jgi:hypothetical protein
MYYAYYTYIYYVDIIYLYTYIHKQYIGIYIFIHIYRRGSEEVASGKNVAQESLLN